MVMSVSETQNITQSQLSVLQIYFKYLQIIIVSEGQNAVLKTCYYARLNMEVE